MKPRGMINGAVGSNMQPEAPGADTGSAGRGRSLRFWQSILGAAFLSLMLVGVALFRALPAPGISADFSAIASVSSARDHSLSHYLHSGQWRADARTLASLVHYLVTP